MVQLHTLGGNATAGDSVVCLRLKAKRYLCMYECIWTKLRVFNTSDRQRRISSGYMLKIVCSIVIYVQDYITSVLLSSFLEVRVLDANQRANTYERRRHIPFVIAIAQ